MNPDAEDTATIYARLRRALAMFLHGLLALALVVAILASTGLLAGCATAGVVQGVCILLPMGQTDAGMMAVRYRCEPE